ncbi:MAG TPA: MAPEG family protein [Allosphingosinicella sp.]|nr:MAPEG family protein [Allosphingosinicella sp.]
MILPITLTIAGACALISIWLGLRVSQLRLRHKISIGDGGNETVRTRMRAHANFAEYTPIFLILLALIELAHGSAISLWIAGILFVVGRLLHPFGMDRPAPNPLRMAGAGLSWAVLLALAACAIATAYLGLDRPAPITYAGSSFSGGTKLS